MRLSKPMMSIPSGRYIVAGASGLVGTHALQHLRSCSEARVTALFHNTRPVFDSPSLNQIRVDLGDKPAACAAFAGGDFLLLLAGLVAPGPVMARDPIGVALANLRILTTSLEAAWEVGIKKVVWLSSTTVYPDIDGPMTEDMGLAGEPVAGWGPIAGTMRYLEVLSKAYASHPVRPMSCVALRPTLIYGAHGRFDDDAHFLPALLRRVVERRNPIEVWGDGEQRRDVVHAADVVEAMFQALERVDGFDVFNIGGGRNYSLNEVLKRLLVLDGFEGARIEHRLGRPSMARTRDIAITKARDVLGYVPRIDLDEGLRRTLAWYRAVHAPEAAKT